MPEATSKNWRNSVIHELNGADRPASAATLGVNRVWPAGIGTRPLARQYQVQQTAEGEDIHSGIGGHSHGLLRCHPCRCADSDIATLTDPGGDTPVEDIDGTKLCYQNVGRGEIPMHDPAAVRKGDGFDGAQEDLHQGDGWLRFFMQIFIERTAVQPLHSEG